MVLPERDHLLATLFVLGGLWLGVSVDLDYHWLDELLAVVQQLVKVNVLQQLASLHLVFHGALLILGY